MASKLVLELLFNKLKQNDYESITNMVPDAMRELQSLSKKLNRGEKMKVNFVRSLLDYCNSGRWEMALHQLDPATEEFYRYFSRKQTPGTRGNQQVNFHLDSNKEHGQERTNSRGRSQLRDIVDDTPEFVQKRFSRPSTDMTYVHTVADIVDKFGQLFQNEWRNALDELETLKVNEVDAMTGLLKIIMDAYKFCTIEADTQITKIEQAVQNVILEDIAIKHKPEVSKSYLSDYRRELAGVCLEKLQQSFRRRYLPEIIRSVGIYQNLRIHGPVHKYTDQCVAISWAMSICDPQMYLVDDRNKHGAFDREMYNEYKTSGQSVAFYVWPPLKVSKHGKLVSKGIAQCHL